MKKKFALACNTENFVIAINFYLFFSSTANLDELDPLIT